MSSNQPISPLALYRNSCLQRQLNIQLRIYDKDLKASRRRLDGTRDECRDQLRILKSERRAYVLENAAKNLKMMEEMGYDRANGTVLSAVELSLKEKKPPRAKTVASKRRPVCTQTEISTGNSNENNDVIALRSCGEKPIRSKVRKTMLRPFTSRPEYTTKEESNSRLKDGDKSSCDTTAEELSALHLRGRKAQYLRPRPLSAWFAGTERTNEKTQNVHFKTAVKTGRELSSKGRDVQEDVTGSPASLTFTRESLPYRYDKPGMRRPHSAPVCAMYTSSNKRFTGISKKEKAGIKADMEKHVQQTKEIIEKSKRLKKYIRRVAGIEEQEEDKE